LKLQQTSDIIKLVEHSTGLEVKVIG